MNKIDEQEYKDYMSLSFARLILIEKRDKLLDRDQVIACTHEIHAIENELFTRGMPLA